MSITTLRIPPHIRSVIDDDGAVLLDVNQGTYFSLNSIGVEVWKRLEGGMTLDQIGAAIAAEFQAAPDVVARDVRVFANRLCERALVDVVE